MTHYVSTSGELPAERLSLALFALSRPLALQPSDCIQDAFEVIQALNGSFWLVVPDEFTLVLHPEASPSEITALLQPWEQNGTIPAGTISALSTWIETTRTFPTTLERTFYPWNHFPAYFRENSKTLTEMISLNLLPNSLIPQ